MTYWVGFSKTGIGEVIRERSYDSIVKARRYAVNVLRRKEYQWADIYSSKDAKYHIENIEIGYSPGTFISSRNGKDSLIKSNGTLGKRPY